MRKILLTGGNGFFGTRFTGSYAGEFSIVSTDVDTLNILDRDLVFKTVEAVKPDIIIHGAAIALTGYCDAHPEKCREINVTGALNMGEAAARSGASMVFLSSEQVYNGNTNAGPFGETDQPVPDTVYGRNKHEAEILLARMVEKLTILRFTWMFGVPGRNLPVVNNVLWDTVKSILQGIPLKVSPREFRGLTWVDEMIENFPKVFNLPPGLYHIGSENPLSRYDITRLIFEEMGLSARMDELLVKDEEKYRDNPRDVRLNTGRINRAGLRFTPTPEAIKQCIREYCLRV